MNICFGHDDIFDPWYPLGTGNMLQVLHMGIHASQLMGYEQIVNSIDLITKKTVPKHCILKRITALKQASLRISSFCPLIMNTMQSVSRLL